MVGNREGELQPVHQQGVLHYGPCLLSESNAIDPIISRDVSTAETFSDRMNVEKGRMKFNVPPARFSILLRKNRVTIYPRAAGLIIDQHYQL